MKTKLYKHLRLFAFFNITLFLWILLYDTVYEGLLLLIMAWGVLFFCHILLFFMLKTPMVIRFRERKKRKDMGAFDVDLHLDLKDYWQLKPYNKPVEEAE